MDPDKYQQAWQAHASQTRVTVDADLLLKEVQRNQRDFRALIFRRDVVEVGIALLMLPLWFYLGVTFSEPWTWYLMVPALIWVIGFFLVDRMRHKQKCIGPGETLLESVKESLIQLEHQIWLLRNVFWWYLLPFTISISAFFAHVTWLDSKDWLDALGHAGFFVFLFALYYFIYYLNQYAVRTQLEPRRQELLTLLTSLRDETTSEVSGEYPILMSAERVKCSCSPRRMFVASLCAVALLLIGIAGVVFLSSLDPVYREKSPFAAVRWQQSQPEVKVGDEWFKLVSLNDLPASEIVAFSRRTYYGMWRKRFEEDLVFVLTSMGHEPKDTVRLVVMPLGSQETRTLEDVPMTRANRRAIWDAAQARERSEREQPTRGSVHIDDAEAPLTKLIIGLRKEKDLVGLAAMVVVDGQVVASAADGERKKGSGVWLEIGDQWHLGGVTKSITATMIARLVESGQMKWSDSIGECFPEASIHEDFKPVTLKQLLTDTAGAPRNFPKEVWLQRPALGPECTLARREAVLGVIADKPANPPGKKYAYSNVGYTIAGAMAEKVTGVTWEDLVKREVFEPLELSEAGFGPPKSADETLEQPRGHRKVLAGKVSVDDEADNTPIMGPSGTVHMTLSDLCTYATEHLRGDLGEGKLLSAETYKLLHTPGLNHYACGWIRKEPGKEIPYTVYWHNGTNTMWYALVVFIPEKNMVVAVTSNDGDFDQAEAAAWEVVKASAKQFNVAADPPRREPLQRADER
jgi:CubicO group peptidase (beta-lactamase class C family)